MKPFEYEIDNLKSICFEMIELVKEQIHLTKEAVLTYNHDLSGEIMRKEKRVNAYELSIDRECEDFLALFAPVATDLRFAIAVLKIAGNLERIGDHAYRIASNIFDDKMKLSKELFELLHIPTIFDEIDEMMHNISESLETGDLTAARKVFKQDKDIDRINKKLPLLLEQYALGQTQDLTNIILVSRMIGKLERIGDLIKNIAEEIIFYYESKVIKHKKKNKKIEKKLGHNTDENKVH